MKTEDIKYKECSNCKESFPYTNEFWHRQIRKNGKYGLRSICKKCVSERQKEYRKLPEIKEKHRVNMNEWRHKNPEKSTQIMRKCYKKNGHKYNAKKREKYKTDPEYKQKCIEIEKRYVLSGRRHEINCKPEMIEAARIRSKKRRENTMLKHHDYEIAKIWRENNSEYLKKLYKSTREELKPSYVATSLRIKVKELTPEILETKQLIIKIKRELKNNNIKIK